MALAQRIKSTNEVVYLHCWGGHGRAGTVVCLLLHFLYDQDAAQAMMRCQFVHDLRRVPIVVGSPQTQTQRDQVSRGVGHVGGVRDHSDLFERRAIEELRHQGEEHPPFERPRLQDDLSVPLI